MVRHCSSIGRVIRRSTRSGDIPGKLVVIIASRMVMKGSSRRAWTLNRAIPAPTIRIRERMTVRELFSAKAVTFIMVNPRLRESLQLKGFGFDLRRLLHQSDLLTVA